MKDEDYNISLLSYYTGYHNYISVHRASNAISRKLSSVKQTSLFLNFISDDREMTVLRQAAPQC